MDRVKKSGLKPANLQQQTFVFLLLPTLLILVIFFGAGFKMVSAVLLEQWQETAIAKLQRSAHHVDMRLMRPKEILRYLLADHRRGQIDLEEFHFLIAQLRSQDGVIAVNHSLTEDLFALHENTSILSNTGKNHDGGLDIVVDTPRFNQDMLQETISIMANINLQPGQPVKAAIEVVISFYDLIDQITKAPWWSTHQAVLIDDAGRVLAGTGRAGDKYIDARSGNPFGHGSRLEVQTLASMQDNIYGTVIGHDGLTRMVSGFYRLSEAPWTMVITSPADDVLEPVLRFRTHYLIVGVIGAALTLLYIRAIVGKLTAAIKDVARATIRLSDGDYHTRLDISGSNEVAQLAESVNQMAGQLQERRNLRQEMHMAREIQQNLLPQTTYSSQGLEIASRSHYCQQTGGDFFDLIPDEVQPQCVTTVVGDVVGHGIGAALIMASVRAYLRGRASMPGTAVEVIEAVNRLLCRDTRLTGNFSTLFYLTVDAGRRRISWIRCGHDPAIVYSATRKVFGELRGNGLVLGYDDSWVFEENRQRLEDGPQVILIGSDGIWEAENLEGERFGKSRVKSILAQYHYLPAEMITRKITDSISSFIAEGSQHDDITLTVLKTW